MHIDQAIKILSEAKASGTENIILSFWTADAFDLTEGEHWANITDILDHTMDWSNAYDSISLTIQNQEYPEPVKIFFQRDIYVCTRNTSCH